MISLIKCYGDRLNDHLVKNIKRKSISDNSLNLDNSIKSDSIFINKKTNLKTDVLRRNSDSSFSLSK